MALADRDVRLHDRIGVCRLALGLSSGPIVWLGARMSLQEVVAWVIVGLAVLYLVRKIRGGNTEKRGPDVPVSRLKRGKRK